MFGIKKISVFMVSVAVLAGVPLRVSALPNFVESVVAPIAGGSGATSLVLALMCKNAYKKSQTEPGARSRFVLLRKLLGISLALTVLSGGYALVRTTHTPPNATNNVLDSHRSQESSLSSTGAPLRHELAGASAAPTGVAGSSRSNSVPAHAQDFDGIDIGLLACDTAYLCPECFETEDGPEVHQQVSDFLRHLSYLFFNCNFPLSDQDRAYVVSTVESLTENRLGRLMGFLASNVFQLAGKRSDDTRREDFEKLFNAESLRSLSVHQRKDCWESLRSELVGSIERNVTQDQIRMQTKAYLVLHWASEIGAGRI